MTRFYRVQTGFGADDFVSIDENELEMCIRAQITGKVAITKGGTITGNLIQKITPDWNRVMGYNRDYKLVGEDYQHIGTKRVDDYRNALEGAKTNVQRALEGLPPIEHKPELSEGSKKLSEKMTVKHE